MNDMINLRIEEWCGEKIVKRTGASGGCISLAEIIVMQSGQSFFLKSGPSGNMFRCEANGLNEIARTGVIRVPFVLLSDENFILLENITQGVKPAGFFRTFGQQFARLHRYTNKKFGFFEDNYIGSTPQINISSEKESGNWIDFFMNKRLLFQLNLAEKNGYSTEKLRKGFHLLENKVESIIKGSEEEPSLLHGDLWSGNFLCDQSRNAVLIDPAVYYGHREADLAMTKLFGGFSPDFYSAYQEEFPLKVGAIYRENLYMLYHVMNHLNLFGSAYYSRAENLLWQYLK